MKSIESGPIPLALGAPKTIAPKTEAVGPIEEIPAASPDEMVEMRMPEVQNPPKDQRGLVLEYIINATPGQISGLRKKEDTYIVPSKPGRVPRY